MIAHFRAIDDKPRFLRSKILLAASEYVLASDIWCVWLQASNSNFYRYVDEFYHFKVLNFPEIKYNMIISKSFKYVKIMTWGFFMEFCKLVL